MTPGAVATLALALLAGLAVGAPRAGAQAPAAPTADVTVRDGRVSLDVRDVPLGELLRLIGERAGVRMNVDGRFATPVTRAFTEVPLESAIRRLARGHSLSFAYAAPADRGGRPRLAEVWVIEGTPAAPRAAPAVRAERARRLQVVSALGRRRDPAAVAELGGILARDGDPLVRARAASALGATRDARAAAALTAALGDPEATVRLAAVSALRRSVGEESADGLARVLAGDPDPRVRRLAATLLGSLRSPIAESALRAGAGDADASVRASAAAALARWSRAPR
jgi:hypothetical protein